MCRAMNVFALGYYRFCMSDRIGFDAIISLSSTPLSDCMTEPNAPLLECSSFGMFFVWNPLSRIHTQSFVFRVLIAASPAKLESLNHSRTSNNALTASLVGAAYVVSDVPYCSFGCPEVARRFLCFVSLGRSSSTFEPL